MSISITKIVNLPQAALKFLVHDETEDEAPHDYETIGGVFSDADYAWMASGPRLQIVHTKTGCKMGAWTFGFVLKDSNTEVVCVDEIQRPHGRLPLLAVGVDCAFSGGMICIFDFVTSKIIRAIHIKEKISYLHVIDAGFDVFTLPGPLRNFDGIIAVGTAGGDVFLIDICRQICDEALTIGGLSETRDELNPCQLSNITSRDVAKIEFHKEFAVRNSHHLAIHLNAVFDKSTRHFTLKGPKGDDRIHVNKDEVTVSALYYCPQLGSLLVGYNFGALQLYNLMTLELIYTSPVCEEHIPISHFAVQEPADDPKAVCYIWAVYSAGEQYPTCLPLAVLYALSYHTKEYHEGYGFLYQEFNAASVHYQMELATPDGHKRISKQRGGHFLKLKSFNQGPIHREGPHHDSTEDNLTVCAFVWSVWFSNKETDTFLAVFDLNQWYKEQMPSVQNSHYSSTYIIQIQLNHLINSATNKSVPILDVHLDKNSLQQFTGPQRLEEHFYPNSISFEMTTLRVSDIIFLHNYGAQKALLAQIESSGPLCLVEPAEIYQELIGLGLVPLFIELPVNTPVTTNQQREIILGAALENQLIGWLCKCASEWANGSFLSAGCSLDLLISWAFQRAVALKANCDKFCVPLFDYSQIRLDNNTIILLNSCTRQLKSVCSLYAFIIEKLSMFISNRELVAEQNKSLETVSIYFEVLQWLLNVGLLPECPLTAYPRSDDLERINAPYPGEMLADFYNHRRALLKILNEENFSSSDSVLFIDTLIERECGGKTLQEQWRNDGGNGLYPPPSLQALLRTYLIDNVKLPFKHSVVIYVFLDLAMTLDQDRYKPVVTHLIKFPAVFKVSPSVIKITQAFWQLDHGDYNTAMGLLLDPLISPDDLSQWHHKVVLRSLMLQKQHNFALLYVQVRKPNLKDDEDIMTAISLYVANNMLDEAFYFEKHCSDPTRNNKFLNHFFNECEKNGKLKSLIYRSFSPEDEKFFLNYLTKSKHSSAAELQVYYHILRSHYLEAFDSHNGTTPNKIESQGLIGQENTTTTEKLVSMLKTLLPEVSRKLLDLCRKEKNHTCQQGTRPTPMSVFVHNRAENVHYKSTLIGAALAKARQTFNDTTSGKFKIDTEGTPFFRTPRASVSSKRSSAIIVNPRIIDVPQSIADNAGPSPAKRLKLSPRLSASFSASIPSKLDTPMVKRKTPKIRESESHTNVTTPHSILKVKSFSSSKADAQFEDDFKQFEKLEYTPVTSAPKKSGLGLSPRKSLAKPSPVVRFEGLTSSSSSSLNNTRNLSDRLSGSPMNISPINTITSPVVNVLSDSNALRLSLSSKNTSTEEEIFYSPEASLEEKEREVEDEINELKAEVPEKIDEVVNADDKPTTVEIVEEIEKIKEVSEEKQSSPVFSPKGRRSYKRSLGQVTPVRSSPRLSRSTNLSKEALVYSPQKEETSSTFSKDILVDNSLTVDLPETDLAEKAEEDNEPAKTPSLLPKLRPRKSLYRKVLETNTANRVLASPLDSPRSRRSTRISEVTNVKESTEKVVLESSVKFEDGEERHSSSFVKKQNLTTSFVESDLDSSDVLGADYYDYFEFAPKLATSYQNRSDTSLSGLEESNLTENVTHDDSVVEEVAEALPVSRVGDVDENKIDNKTQEDATDADKSHNENIVTETKSSEPQIADEKTENQIAKTVAEADNNISQNKSLAYSVLDSSTECFSISYDASGPKLSESMIRCINNREFTDSNIEDTQTEDEEVMEVDDVQEIEEKTEAVQNKSDELVYETLQNSDLNEETKEDNMLDGCADSSGRQEKKGEEKSESVDGDSTNNRPIDPEMNVFEISDDLSFNDGLVIEKEVTFEENDLYYDQQNTLESVLEENIAAVSVASLNVFEKNVFSCSEEESSGEYQEEPYVEPSEDAEKHEDQPFQNPEDEIIEIGSSSEDEDKSKSGSSDLKTPNSSEYDESSVENLEVSYERNIYDTYNDYSSEESQGRPYSEISENSDDVKSNDNEECGLFQGDIILAIPDEEKRNEDAEDNNSDEQEESFEQDAIEDPLEVKVESTSIVEENKDDLSEAEERNTEEGKDEPINIVEDNKEDALSEASRWNSEEVKDGLTDVKENREDDLCEATERNQENKEDTSCQTSENDKKLESPIEANISSVSKENVTDQEMESEILVENQEDVEEKHVDMSSEMEALNYSDSNEVEVIPQENIQDDSQKDYVDTHVSLEVKEAEKIAENELGEGQSLTNEKEKEKEELQHGELAKEDESVDKEQERESEIKDSEHIQESLPEALDTDVNLEKDEQKMDTTDIVECPSSLDPLDTVNPTPIKSIDRKNTEVDFLCSVSFDTTKSEGQEKKPRTRSTSVSSSVSARSSRRNRRKDDTSDANVAPKRSTRTTVDILDTLPVSKTPETDVLDDLSLTVRPIRNLRSRRVSTEENTTPTPAVSLRKRSASVDETKPFVRKLEVKQDVEVEEKKGRNRRAASVSHLPKISEEDGVKQKRPASVLEGYSMSRRMTRQQIALLKNTMSKSNQEEKSDLEYMDPIVLLDKLPFEGPPDPEEEKVYETSPSTTNSASSSPVKTARRLRSASQASDTSQRSRSKTPVRTVKSRLRKKSSDEISNQSTRSTTSKKKSKEPVKDDIVVSEPRATRSRAKSVSSVVSEDSNVSETSRSGKRKQKVTAHVALPEIQEESDNSEKATIPKKRTRKNSSQL